jgi:hypothetical protein
MRACWSRYCRPGGGREHHSEPERLKRPRAGELAPVALDRAARRAHAGLRRAVPPGVAGQSPSSSSIRSSWPSPSARARGARLDHAGVRGDDEVGDRRVLGLAERWLTIAP